MRRGATTSFANFDCLEPCGAEEHPLRTLKKNLHTRKRYTYHHTKFQSHRTPFSFTMALKYCFARQTLNRSTALSSRLELSKKIVQVDKCKRYLSDFFQIFSVHS